MKSQFGERVRTLREQHNLSLRQVAPLLQIDTAQLSKIEKGLRQLKRDQIPILAEILKASNDELMTMWLADQIYAEVIIRGSLIDQLSSEFKITVASPTTLMAILKSLQMGSKTLALQKRSSEVWKVLGSVKKEFEVFGGLFEKAHKNIQTVLGQSDDVVGTRTRAIQH